ncbi:MAG: phosphate ABC transporter permease PstA [Bacteroidia bacterium]|nr:phosphate ABC transporter permease PstA [Bacteroidia bacterium]
MNNEQKKNLKNNLFKAMAISATLFGLFILAVLLISIVIDGFGRLSMSFFTDLPSRKADQAGIYTAWTGTLWIMIVTALFALPVGIAAGIYLQEYGRKNKFASFVDINISNLAGVPSIIYGLLGLEFFVRWCGLGQSILSGSLTLALLILPIIIVSTREALKAVPDTIREASYALGASQWQTIQHQVLPAASGGIMTGVILSLSRAVGETAPLIVVGALTYVPFAPSNWNDSFTVLPIQIFNWASRPQQDFLVNAAAGIIVLLVITFLMNGTAIYLRNRWQKKIKW